MTITSPTDRIPSLSQLLRRDEFERALRPIIQATLVDGVALFDRSGDVFVVVARDGSPLASWEQLPVEAMELERRQSPAGDTTRAERPVFGIGGHLFGVRPAFAGADKVGTLVMSAPVREGEEALRRVIEANAGLLGLIMQSSFAAWVTSEMHLAASESTYADVQRHNAELQRAVDHLKEIDKLKSNFLATVSHELRTPLTSVIGFSEMLLENLAGPLNEEQREYVSTILARGEELLRLITQILEMSKLEVGAMRLDLASSDVADLVGAAVSCVGLSAERAGVRVFCEIEPERLPKVLADGGKVQQILVNLLANAVKFADRGGWIAVRAHPGPIRRPFVEETLFGEELADAVVVEVEDSGAGVPADQLERIFEPFYQADSSPTRAHGGAGLGLSIVRNLVEAHGGEVWVESPVGKGATFRFTLPLAQPKRASVSSGG